MALLFQPFEVKSGDGDVSRVVLSREDLVFVDAAYCAVGCLGEVGITRGSRFENFGDGPGLAVVGAHFDGEAFAVTRDATRSGKFAFEVVGVGKNDVAVLEFEDAAHAHGFEQGVIKL